jgi:hypothetical protein
VLALWATVEKLISALDENAGRSRDPLTQGGQRDNHELVPQNGPKKYAVIFLIRAGTQKISVCVSLAFPRDSSVIGENYFACVRLSNGRAGTIAYTRH